MRRGITVFALSAVVAIAGCGGILGFGEDPPPPTEAGDAASDAVVAETDASAALDASGEVSVADVQAGDGGDAGRVLRVFATNAKHAANLLASPDALCAAAAVGLGGVWRAWVSHANRQAASVILGDGPWATTGGQIVAVDRKQLLSGSLAHAIDTDENGAVITSSTEVWTGTDHTGTDTAYTCEKWSLKDDVLGVYGRATDVDEGWTNFREISCANAFRIYCFEQP